MTFKGTYYNTKLIADYSELPGAMYIGRDEQDRSLWLGIDEIIYIIPEPIG